MPVLAVRYVAIDPHDLDRHGGKALDEGGRGTARRLGGATSRSQRHTHYAVLQERYVYYIKHTSSFR